MASMLESGIQWKFEILLVAHGLSAEGLLVETKGLSCGHGDILGGNIWWSDGLFSGQEGLSGYLSLGGGAF